MGKDVYVFTETVVLLFWEEGKYVHITYSNFTFRWNILYSFGLVWFRNVSKGFAYV